MNRNKKNVNTAEKKPFYKKWWFILLMGIVVFGSLGETNDEEGVKAEEEEISEVDDTEELEKLEEEKLEEEEKVKAEEEEKLAKEESQREEVKEEEERLDYINSRIAEDVELGKGWALGTIDENAEPTESGEPDFSRRGYLYISRIQYDGSGLNVYTDGGFNSLSTSEKDLVANTAMGASLHIIGSNEEWEAREYQRGLFLTVFNGENSLGHSKVFELKEYTWND